MHCCHRNRSGNFWQGWKGEYLTLLRKQESLTQAERAGKICYKLVAKTHRLACEMKATYFLLGFYIE